MNILQFDNTDITTIITAIRAQLPTQEQEEFMNDIEKINQEMGKEIKESIAHITPL